MTLLSIITITRNNRAGLASTASSIIRQTSGDYEWIIIDGASTDGTTEDFIIYPSARIISEPDKGIYDAMNKGLALAEGDYVIFMNAGDQFASDDSVARLADAAATHPAFIYGDSLEGGHYKPAKHPSRILWGMPTHHQAMAYQRAALGTLRYNTDYRIAADYDFTLRFLNTPRTTIYIPAPICIFEQGGVSQIQVKRGRDEQYQARKKNGACGPVLNTFIRAVQTIAWQLRNKAEPLYWIIKKRRISY